MWIAIVIAYFLISLLIFVIGRLSPYERHRNGDSLTLENSFWLVLAAFLQRSTTAVQPKVRQFFKCGPFNGDFASNVNEQRL